MSGFFKHIPDDKVLEIFNQSLADKKTSTESAAQIPMTISPETLALEQYKTKTQLAKFIFAACTDNTDAIKKLINRGASPDLANMNGTSMLSFAVQHNCWSATNLLLELGANVNMANKEGNTALHLAASEGNAKIAKLLIDHGANPTAFNHNNEKPADAATQSANFELSAALNGTAEWWAAFKKEDQVNTFARYYAYH